MNTADSNPLRALFTDRKPILDVHEVRVVCPACYGHGGVCKALYARRSPEGKLFKVRPASACEGRGWVMATLWREP